MHRTTLERNKGMQKKRIGVCFKTQVGQILYNLDYQGGSDGEMLLLISEVFLLKKRRSLRNLVAVVLKKYKAYCIHAPF